jgi:hypothetical protein
VNRAVRTLLTDPVEFSRRLFPDHGLRAYQVEPVRAIVESVERGLGHQFVLLFSRQSGKDELLAQLLAFLLVRHQRGGGQVVMAAPTARPQAAISRDRLAARLKGCALALEWGPAGQTIHVGGAAAHFLSAAPTANVRGHTADLLLVANEAQDIDPAIWDARFDPMAASTNATTVYSGTSWTRDGLLSRQRRHLEDVQARDGRSRVFRVPWEIVAAELPAYGERVRARIDQLGEQHPFVRTEYFLEELDGEGGLFPPQRIAQLRGDHPRRHGAEEGKRYALLLDVAGEEETEVGPDSFEDQTRRDSTALTVIEVITSRERHEPPRYRIVDRRAWTGVRHSRLHAQLVDLARSVWRASWVVVDATGVGAGLASFLAAELAKAPRIHVEPFVFTSASKSGLGWNFIGLIDSGRVKDYADDGEQLSRLFYSQLAATTYEILAGPGKLLRWSVPAERGHDDLVISAALVAALDGLDLRARRAVGSGGLDDERKRS